jgi:hypothetical protein
MTVFGLGKNKKMGDKAGHGQQSSDDDAKQVLKQIEDKRQASQDTCMFC